MQQWLALNTPHIKNALKSAKEQLKKNATDIYANSLQVNQFQNAKRQNQTENNTKRYTKKDTIKHLKSTGNTNHPPKTV